MPRRDKPEWVKCPSCGKLGIKRGLMGGSCAACGKSPAERAKEEAGYDRFGRPLDKQGNR